MIEYLKIEGFRCFQDEEFKFNSGMNVLVGENDSGKSSILDVIRIFSGDYNVDASDFNTFMELDTKTNIVIEMGIGNGITFCCNISNENPIQYEWNILLNKKHFLQYIELEFDENIIKRFYKVVKNTRVKNIDSMKSEVISHINLIEQEEYPVFIDNRNTITEFFSNIKYEDGKTFSNVQENFKNYIKDDINKIWYENVELKSGYATLEKIIGEKLNEIKRQKEDSYKDDLLPSIRKIIPTIKDMKIKLEPNLGKFSSFNSNISFTSKGNNTPINIDKKGDGTKRRLTLALFEHESLNDSINNKTFLFDEPDTHLNLRVQKDMLDVFKSLVTNGNQVIFTTHSPFLLNLVSLGDVIFLENDGYNSKKKNINKNNISDFDSILYNLGIENIDVFFSKGFVFFEGLTEVEFFSRMYQKVHGYPISKQFIKFVSCDGVDNGPIFIKNFKSIIGDKLCFIAVLDSDYKDKKNLKDFIDGLKIQDKNLFTLGTREFEDEFSDETLSKALNIDKLEDITNARKEKKFSSALKKLTKYEKPEIGKKLAEYCTPENLPNNIKKVLDVIDNFTN